MNMNEAMHALVIGEIQPSDNDRIYADYAINTRDKLDCFLSHPATQKILDEVAAAPGTPTGVHALMHCMYCERNMMIAWITWYAVRATQEAGNAASLYLAAYDKYKAARNNDAA